MLLFDSFVFWLGGGIFIDINHFGGGNGQCQTLTDETCTTVQRFPHLVKAIYHASTKTEFCRNLRLPKKFKMSDKFFSASTTLIKENDNRRAI